MTGYDTRTWSAVHYTCGTGGQFTPVRLVSGTQPNVLYSTGTHEEPSEVVSIITLA